MLRFALTIFTSAFLLFQVQPLIARYILPWFGGTPAVWSTCMLFFQLVLLAGYGYAHALNHFFKPKKQALIHLVLLVIACVTLPIIPRDALRPTGEENPVMQILLVLSLTIGLPYFVVSTTGPLLQSWFAATYPGRSPYRLFALSNFGSLVALLTYPFVFEPYFRQKTQAYGWSGGFIVFAALCGWCALMIYRERKIETVESGREKESDVSPIPGHAYSHTGRPGPFLVLLWIGLSMVPSILLLATTNQVCQEIAVVPFLWVVPLALYLVTFIICFEAPYLYIRFVFYPLFGLSVVAAVVCLHMGVDAPMWIQAGGLMSAFFLGSLVCHGELACNKPEAKYLTLYYLAVSIGGALGGVFVVLCAPVLFTAYFELHVGLVLAICLTVIAFHTRTKNRFFETVPYGVSVVGFGVAAILLCWPVIDHARTASQEADDDDYRVEYKVRDFWGILTVKRSGSVKNKNERLQLLNGRINHGNQFVAEQWRLYKTTYYCEGSGIALAIERNPRRLDKKEMRIAVIGLGTGTVAAWGEDGDLVRFYEINPEVEKVAEENFYYLRESREKNGTEVDVVLGDARIQMQRQLENGKQQKFDVIAVDAFSSDAIPRHLLTLECVKLYEKHLRDPGQGIIAIHISNRFLDLEGICHRIGVELGYQPILIECEPDEDDLHWGYDNTWVLFTKSDKFRQDPEIQDAKWRWEIEWRKTDLEDLILVETGKEINLAEETQFDFNKLAEQYAESAVGRLRILYDEWTEAKNKPDAGFELELSRANLESFLNQEAGLEFDLAKQTTLDFDDAQKRLTEKRHRKIAEMKKEWEKAKRQFDVLWTDDFGSLWQVIKLEFDLKQSGKDVAQWWKEWNNPED